MIGFSLLAVAAATIASISIPGHDSGINFGITGLLGIGAVWTATRRALDAYDALFLCLALGLLGLTAIRSTGWVLALDLAGGGLALSVGVSRARGWIGVSLSGARVLRNLLKGIPFAVGPLVGGVARGAYPQAAPLLRAAALGAVPVLVFGALFISADAAFASLAEQLLLPDWDLSLLPARAFVAVGTIAAAGAFTLVSPRFTTSGLSPWSLRPSRSLTIEFGTTEWKTALIAVDALFAAFVGVQIAVLFGGHDHVLRTEGLTYAEYARQGFFQLLVVAVLALGLIALTVKRGTVDGNDRTWMKVLLGALCLLTLVVLASAFKRMNLYQEAYGFTRLRLLVDLTIVILGVTFGMLLVAGIRWNGMWLPRGVVILGAVGLIGFSLYNPDARIAQRNIERFERTGEIDLAYLAGLSPDAVPELLELREPYRSCVLDAIATRLDDESSFWAWNQSREDARSALRAADIRPGAVCSPS